jgi:hypothetical protein
MRARPSAPGFIQRQLGHHVLQLPVLVFQLPQLLRIPAVHPAVLAFQR